MTTQTSPTDGTDQSDLPPSIDISEAIRHDLFAAIKYERRMGRKHFGWGCQIDTKFVFVYIVQRSWTNICASVTTADKGKCYTCEELLNWSHDAVAFGETVRSETDLCLAYFVREKMLPLRCINPEAAGTKLYQVISR